MALGSYWRAAGVSRQKMLGYCATIFQKYKCFDLRINNKKQTEKVAPLSADPSQLDSTNKQNPPIQQNLGSFQQNFIIMGTLEPRSNTILWKKVGH